MQHQPFLLQPLVQQNHLITPITHTIMLYGVKLTIAHSNDAVGVMLSPIRAFAKHCDRLVTETGQFAWTLRYKDLKHTDTPGIKQGDCMVIVTQLDKAPPLLSTIANIANFHYRLNSLVALASDRAANLNLEIFIENEENEIEIRRADKDASIHITHASDCLTISIAPISTFWRQRIVWEGADNLGFKYGVIPLSMGNQLVNIRQTDDDSADIEFTFPEDLGAAQLVVEELERILAE